MSKSTFDYLCNQLRPLIQSSTPTLLPLSVERRVAITLWTLSTPGDYRTIGHLFGVARSTVCVIVPVRQQLSICSPSSLPFRDPRVLVHSNFNKQAVAGNVLPASKTKLIGGVQVQPYIIGDAAYPLKSSELTEDAKTYNYRISRPRMVVENAFGRLKGRWCHLKRCDRIIEKVPTIIAACCVCTIYMNFIKKGMMKDGARL